MNTGVRSPPPDERTSAFLVPRLRLHLAGRTLRAAMTAHPSTKAAMARKLHELPRWLDDVAPENFPAAESYLSLVFAPKQVRKLIAALKDASACQFKAKDIFRASGLSLLGISNYQVEKDRQKIRDGTALSPILLVRDEASVRVVIADGYHRLCAVYACNEDELVPCRIV